MKFLDLIKSSGYITVSKELAREIGLNESVILAELISQYEYFKDRGELDEEGYFYCTVDKMTEQTTLKKDAQQKAISSLEKQNLIKKEIKGLPARRHFKINEQEIIALFFDDYPDDPQQLQIEGNPPTRQSENLQQGKGKSSNYHNKEVQEYKNKKTVCAAEQHSPPESPPPFDKIINKLNQEAGKDFSPEAKHTRKLIRQLYRQGWDLDDIVEVIKKKVAEWENTRFSQYLRPKTLFDPANFEGYLNQNWPGDADNDGENERDKLHDLEHLEHNGWN